MGIGLINSLPKLTTSQSPTNEPPNLIDLINRVVVNKGTDSIGSPNDYLTADLLINLKESINKTFSTEDISPENKPLYNSLLNIINYTIDTRINNLQQNIINKQQQLLKSLAEVEENPKQLFQAYRNFYKEKVRNILPDADDVDVEKITNNLLDIALHPEDSAIVFADQLPPDKVNELLSLPLVKLDDNLRSLLYKYHVAQGFSPTREKIEESTRSLYSVSLPKMAIHSLINKAPVPSFVKYTLGNMVNDLMTPGLAIGTFLDNIIHRRGLSEAFKNAFDDETYEKFKREWFKKELTPTEQDIASAISQVGGVLYAVGGLPTVLPYTLAKSIPAGLTAYKESKLAGYSDVFSLTRALAYISSEVGSELALPFEKVLAQPINPFKSLTRNIIYSLGITSANEGLEEVVNQFTENLFDYAAGLRSSVKPKEVIWAGLLGAVGGLAGGGIYAGGRTISAISEYRKQRNDQTFENIRILQEALDNKLVNFDGQTIELQIGNKTIPITKGDSVKALEEAITSAYVGDKLNVVNKPKYDKYYKALTNPDSEAELINARNELANEVNNKNFLLDLHRAGATLKVGQYDTNSSIISINYDLLKTLIDEKDLRRNLEKVMTHEVSHSILRSMDDTDFHTIAMEYITTPNAVKPYASEYGLSSNEVDKMWLEYVQDPSILDRQNIIDKQLPVQYVNFRNALEDYLIEKHISPLIRHGSNVIKNAVFFGVPDIFDLFAKLNTGFINRAPLNFYEATFDKEVGNLNEFLETVDTGLNENKGSEILDYIFWFADKIKKNEAKLADIGTFEFSVGGQPGSLFDETEFSARYSRIIEWLNMAKNQAIMLGYEDKAKKIDDIINFFDDRLKSELAPKKPAEPTEAPEKPVETPEKPTEKPVETTEKPTEEPIETPEKPAETLEKPVEPSVKLVEEPKPVSQEPQAVETEKPEAERIVIKPIRTLEEVLAKPEAATTEPELPIDDVAMIAAVGETEEEEKVNADNVVEELTKLLGETIKNLGRKLGININEVKPEDILTDAVRYLDDNEIKSSIVETEFKRAKDFISKYGSILEGDVYTKTQMSKLRMAFGLEELYDFGLEEDSIKVYIKHYFNTFKHYRSEFNEDFKDLLNKVKSEVDIKEGDSILEGETIIPNAYKVIYAFLKYPDTRKHVGEFTKRLDNIIKENKSNFVKLVANTLKLVAQSVVEEKSLGDVLTESNGVKSIEEFLRSKIKFEFRADENRLIVKENDIAHIASVLGNIVFMLNEKRISSDILNLLKVIGETYGSIIQSEIDERKGKVKRVFIIPPFIGATSGKNKIPVRQRSILEVVTLLDPWGKFDLVNRNKVRVGGEFFVEDITKVEPLMAKQTEEEEKVEERIEEEVEEGGKEGEEEEGEVEEGEEGEVEEEEEGEVETEETKERFDFLNNVTIGGVGLKKLYRMFISIYYHFKWDVDKTKEVVSDLISGTTKQLNRKLFGKKGKPNLSDLSDVVLLSDILPLLPYVYLNIKEIERIDIIDLLSEADDKVKEKLKTIKSEIKNVTTKDVMQNFSDLFGLAYLLHLRTAKIGDPMLKRRIKNVLLKDENFVNQVIEAMGEHIDEKIYVYYYEKKGKEQKEGEREKDRNKKRERVVLRNLMGKIKEGSRDETVNAFIEAVIDKSDFEAVFEEVAVENILKKINELIPTGFHPAVSQPIGIGTVEKSKSGEFEIKQPDRFIKGLTELFVLFNSGEISPEGIYDSLELIVGSLGYTISAKNAAIEDVLGKLQLEKYSRKERLYVGSLAFHASEIVGSVDTLKKKLRKVVPIEVTCCKIIIDHIFGEGAFDNYFKYNKEKATIAADWLPVIIDFKRAADEYIENKIMAEVLLPVVTLPACSWRFLEEFKKSTFDFLKDLGRQFFAYIRKPTKSSGVELSKKSIPPQAVSTTVETVSTTTEDDVSEQAERFKKNAFELLKKVPEAWSTITEVVLSNRQITVNELKQCKEALQIIVQRLKVSSAAGAVLAKTKWSILFGGPTFDEGMKAKALLDEALFKKQDRGKGGDEDEGVALTVLNYLETIEKFLEGKKGDEKIDLATMASLRNEFIKLLNVYTDLKNFVDIVYLAQSEGLCKDANDLLEKIRKGDFTLEERLKLYSVIGAVLGNASSLQNKIYTFYVNSLLSGPETFAKNLSSTAYGVFNLISEHLVSIIAPLFGEEHASFIDLLKADKMFLITLYSHLMPLLLRNIKGTWAAKISAMKASLLPTMRLSEYEKIPIAPKGKIWRVITIPTSIIYVIDEANKTFFGFWYAVRNSVVQARMRNVADEDLLNFIINDLFRTDKKGRLEVNPHSDSWQNAIYYMDKIAFINEFEHKSISQVHDFLKYELHLKWLVPFTTVIANMTKASIRLSGGYLPYLFSRYGYMYIKSILKNDTEFNLKAEIGKDLDKIGEGMLGLVLFLLMPLYFNLFEQFQIITRSGEYGSGTGLPEGSVTNGNIVVNIRNVEPYNFTIVLNKKVYDAFVAIKHHLRKNSLTLPVFKRILTQAASGMLSELTDYGALKTLHDLDIVLSGDPSYVTNMVQNVFSGFVPNFIKQTYNIFLRDTVAFGKPRTYYDVGGFIRGLTQLNLRAEDIKLNVFGTPFPNIRGRDLTTKLFSVATAGVLPRDISDLIDDKESYYIYCMQVAAARAGEPYLYNPPRSIVEYNIGGRNIMVEIAPIHNKERESVVGQFFKLAMMDLEKKLQTAMGSENAMFMVAKEKPKQFLDFLDKIHNSITRRITEQIKNIYESEIADFLAKHADEIGEAEIIFIPAPFSKPLNLERAYGLRPIVYEEIRRTGGIE